MLRDGVCDETSNNAKCLFDGGDCCKENKDRSLCLDCTCHLEVVELEKRFNALKVNAVKDLESMQIEIGNSGGWTVEVEEVFTMEVCSVLCLDHENAAELNAWHYEGRICRCGWIESKSCPGDMVNMHWILESKRNISSGAVLDHKAYIQLNKTICCGEFYVLEFVKIHV